MRPARPSLPPHLRSPPLAAAVPRRPVTSLRLYNRPPRLRDGTCPSSSNFPKPTARPRPLQALLRRFTASYFPLAKPYYHKSNRLLPLFVASRSNATHTTFTPGYRAGPQHLFQRRPGWYVDTSSAQSRFCLSAYLTLITAPAAPTGSSQAVAGMLTVFSSSGAIVSLFIWMLTAIFFYSTGGD